MKITTRIAAGLFLIAGLLIGVLAYQLSLTDRLQAINRELSQANIESAQISIRLIQGVEGGEARVRLKQSEGRIQLIASKK